MNYKYTKTDDISDATSNYILQGTFPVKFIDFFNWIIKNDDSFIIKFGSMNTCYGGWLGNRIEIGKEKQKWHFVRREPNNWLEEIAHKKVTACWCNGGWGQMTYFCTFEE